MQNYAIFFIPSKSKRKVFDKYLPFIDMMNPENKHIIFLFNYQSIQKRFCNFAA